MTRKEEIEFSKRMNAFARGGDTSFCFYPDKSSCSKKVILAHGLQKNGVLSLIESMYKGENKLLSLEGIQKNKENLNQPMPIIKGKKTSTTYKGFCNHHDTTLFSIIENQNGYSNLDDINFMHSYRSFVYSYHHIVKEYKSFVNNDIYSTRDKKVISK